VTNSNASGAETGDPNRDPKVRARVLAGMPMVSTLRTAHEVMRGRWPGRDAPLAKWLAFHEVGAALYAEMAELDRFHHHEALGWATRERAQADLIRERIEEHRVRAGASDLGAPAE
jgi:hypothetical protein